jgi:hypothetical protein
MTAFMGLVGIRYLSGRKGPLTHLLPADADSIHVFLTSRRFVFSSAIRSLLASSRLMELPAFVPFQNRRIEPVDRGGDLY